MNERRAEQNQVGYGERATELTAVIVPTLGGGAGGSKDFCTIVRPKKSVRTQERKLEKK